MCEDAILTENVGCQICKLFNNSIQLQNACSADLNRKVTKTAAEIKIGWTVMVYFKLLS